MGRPRAFDEAEVVTRAMRTFWEQGYEATSVADLVASTGLSKGSLYKAFGDKQRLFARALSTYLSEGRQALRERLEGAPSGRDGLEGWLRSIGAMAVRGEPRRGCFGVNTTVELAARDAAIRALVREHEAIVEALYAQAIRRGIEEGAFREDLEPHQAARYVSVVIHGLQTLGRSSLRADEIDHLIRSTLRAFE